MSEDKVYRSLNEALDEPEKVFKLDPSENKLESLSAEFCQLQNLPGGLHHLLI